MLSMNETDGNGSKGFHDDDTGQLPQVAAGLSGCWLDKRDHQILPLRGEELKVHDVIDGVFQKVAHDENRNGQSDAER